MNTKYYAALRNYCSRYGIDWRFDTIQNPITLIWEVLRVVNALTKDMVEMKELMTQELQNLINELVEDGTLEELINVELLSQKLDVVAFDNFIENFNTNALTKDTPLFFDWKNHLLITNTSNTTGNSETTGTVYYSNPQGSAIVGSNIIIAYINTGDIPIDNMVVLREYDLNTGTFIREKKLMLYHANGMDYDPITNRLFVAHNSTYTDGVMSFNNTVSVIDYTTLNIVQQVTPSLPEGRRVKSFTIDKVTNKRYIADDQGIFEVDNNFNVLKTIPFGKRSLVTGVGQNVVVHNNIIYSLFVSPSVITIYNIKGEFLQQHTVERVNSEGYFIGEEPQSINIIDNEIYLVSRYGYDIIYSDQMHTTVMKSTLQGKEKALPYSNPFYTVKNVYVDGSFTGNNSDGTQSKPFKTLNLALNYVVNQPFSYEFTINVAAGDYGFTNFLGDGRHIQIKGAGNTTVFNGMRFFNTNITLSNCMVKINPDRYNYALSFRNSRAYLQTITVDGNSTKQGIFGEMGSIIIQDTVTIQNATQGIYVNNSEVAMNNTFTNVTKKVDARSSSLIRNISPDDITGSNFASFVTVLVRGTHTI